MENIFLNNGPMDSPTKTINQNKDEERRNREINKDGKDSSVGS